MSSNLSTRRLTLLTTVTARACLTAFYSPRAKPSRACLCVKRPCSRVRAYVHPFSFLQPGARQFHVQRTSPDKFE